MPITEEQRQLRKQYIGSSDVAAIMGFSPFANAADIYWQKVGDASQPESEAMALGTRLETAILDDFEQEIGRRLLRNVFQDKGILCANHDAIVDARPYKEGVEAKTTGLLGPLKDQWGEPGTDEIPEYILLQCQTQIHVSDLELVWVPVLIGGRGRPTFKVEPDDFVIRSIVEAADRFMTNHVAKRIPPENVVPSLEVVKRIRREPNKVISIPDSIIENWNAAKASLKAAKEQEEMATAAVLATLGDAECGDCSSGRLTYLEQTRKAYEVKESTYRVLRFKARKGNDDGK